MITEDHPRIHGNWDILQRGVIPAVLQLLRVRLEAPEGDSFLASALTGHRAFSYRSDRNFVTAGSPEKEVGP